MLFIENLNLNLIDIKDPEVIDNNENGYYFKITYDENDLIFDCKNEYKLDKINNGLVILNKNDASFFSSIYKQIIKVFYDKHGSWFDEKMELTFIKDLFNNYLVPNIEENCLNLNMILFIFITYTDRGRYPREIWLL